MSKRSLITTLSIEQLTAIVSRSSSLSEVANALGLKLHGSTYVRLLSRLRDDIPHYTELFVKVKRAPRRRSTRDLFTPNSKVSGRCVKKRILQDKLVPYCCVFCSNEGQWNGKPLVLRLDHIDGVRNNHTLQNLRFVCPNCDSQLPTFTGRNQRRPTKRVPYCQCGKPKGLDAPKCVACAQLQMVKIQWPPAESLMSRVTAGASFVALGRELGVSDNAVRKFLKRHGYTTPKRRYLALKPIEPIKLSLA